MGKKTGGTGNRKKGNATRYSLTRAELTVKGGVIAGIFVRRGEDWGGGWQDVRDGGLVK